MVTVLIAVAPAVPSGSVSCTEAAAVVTPLIVTTTSAIVKVPLSSASLAFLVN